MRLTKKLLAEVVSKAVGIDAVDMALYLKGKKDVSEIVIAKDLNLSVQEARSLLYRLYESNLVSFVRKRDKYKGWHVGYWDFLDDNVIKLHRYFMNKELENLKKRLQREKQFNFYMCKYACARIEFDRAAELNFKCPECGSLMNPVDNKRTIEVLAGKIRELEATASE